MVSKATINQSWVKLVYPNDPKNPCAESFYPDSFWKRIISRLDKKSGKACSEILPRSSYFNRTNPGLDTASVTDETVLKLSSMFSIYTQNLINHTNVTSVGIVQYLEGGEGGSLPRRRS